jgi:ketosteroid isomerase-like protein
VTLQEQQNAVETMFRHGLDSLMAKDVSGWVDMWAEDGTMEFPFAPAAHPRLQGKKAVAEYMKAFPTKVEISSFPFVRFHHSADGKTMVVEFSCIGRSLETGNQYNQSYVGVMDIRDGKISAYKDYFNPLVVLQSMGTDAFERFVAAGGAHQ